MACNHNCQSCASPCVLAKFAQRLASKTKMEENKMSEVTALPGATCHSTDPEKLVSHGERINAISAGGKCCIGCLAVVAALIVGACLYLNGKIGDLQLKQAEEITRIKTEYSVRLAALEKQVEEIKENGNVLKEYAADGRRAYEATKKFRQRER